VWRRSRCASASSSPRSSCAKCHAENALPKGAFATVGDVLAARRVALSAVEPNEPVLANKITGRGSARRCPRAARRFQGRHGSRQRRRRRRGFVLPAITSTCS